MYGHDENCDCAVCDDIAFRRSLKFDPKSSDDELLLVRAELITERALSDMLRSNEQSALSKAEFWRVSHDAACEDAKNWRRDAQDLQGICNDILEELKARNIHLLSKHCWCEPDCEPAIRKGGQE